MSRWTSNFEPRLEQRDTVESLEEVIDRARPVSYLIDPTDDFFTYLKLLNGGGTMPIVSKVVNSLPFLIEYGESQLLYMCAARLDLRPPALSLPTDIFLIEHLMFWRSLSLIRLR